MRISDWSSDVCSSDLAEGLEGRLRIVDKRHHDLPVARGIGLADEREIAVQDTFLDHRIAGHFQRIMLSRPQQGGGDGEAFGALQRLDRRAGGDRSEEHTSELQSLMRISYAVFC